MKTTILKNEFWYGGAVYEGYRQPVGADDIVDWDFRENQPTIRSCLYSFPRKTGYIWAIAGFHISFRRWDPGGRSGTYHSERWLQWSARCIPGSHESAFSISWDQTFRQVFQSTSIQFLDRTYLLSDPEEYPEICKRYSGKWFSIRCSDDRWWLVSLLWKVAVQGDKFQGCRRRCYKELHEIGISVMLLDSVRLLLRIRWTFPGG